MKAKNLGKQGRAFWKRVQADFAMEDAHDLERLTMAARCLDDIAEAEQQIEKDGPFVRDRYGQIKEHPAGKVIREHRIIFCRIVRELGLDLDIPESRPPRQY